ncbi:hypothetical protein BCR34DRAFT_599501 [Clohesyomyces aquaticus]|uniref:Rhodopsin domain-containing protein n=1 Tax=Clohesyomyces aquaticus TaxID=1231657 RepID=A0A1Y1ZV42_9PLEO|nr:hypothetical protein BCR34DRAFT_599501 [Clohesyomyces aquaticus]
MSPPPNLDNPAALPPPGVVANFTNPPNEAVLGYSIIIICIVIVTFFAWFRFAIKLFIVRTLHFEDYLIPFAWLAAMGHYAVSLVVFDFAPVIHTWDITLRTLSTWLFYFRLTAVLYNFSILLIKLSILIQVQRVFVPRGPQTKTFYLICSLIVTNLLFYVALIFAIIFNCSPMEKGWKPWVEGTCLSITGIAIAQAIFNLISDLLILFITQKVIWEIVRVKRSERIGLSVVFCAGIIPCGFSAMCLYYNYREKHSADLTYAAALMSMACYGEIASGMFVLFLPVLPRFFKHLKMKPLFPSLFRSRGTSGSGKGSEELDFVDVGVAGGEAGGGVRRGHGRSVWHISYSYDQNQGRTERVVTRDPTALAKEFEFKEFGGEMVMESVSSVYSQDEVLVPARRG